MADVSAIIQKAIRLYRDKIASVKVRGKGLSAYNRFSEEAGNVCVDVLHSIENDVSGEDELRQVTQALFKENHDTVSQATASAIQKMNEDAGVGLKPLKPSYDPSAAGSITEKVMGKDSIREGIYSASNDILLQSQKTADRAMQMNAGFQSKAGMQVLVSREYDNKGIHTTDKGGGEACQWCLSRCGSDVPYQEAYAKGMFERHPGCGCVITYKSEKGTFTQGKGQWESNDWDAAQSKIKKIRFAEGERERSTIKINGIKNNLTVNYKLVNQKAYHDKFEALTPHKRVNESIYREAQKILERRSGYPHEDILAIDSRSGVKLTENLSAAENNREYQCGFTKKELDKINALSDGFEVVHNHPNSSYPSRDDISMLFHREKQTGSIITCHNGDIYRIGKIKSPKDIDAYVENMYTLVKEKYEGYPDYFVENKASEFMISDLKKRGFITFDAR